MCQFISGWPSYKALQSRCMSRKLLSWDRENYIFSKVTKMGSTFGHRIGCNGVGVLRGQRHIPSNPLPPPAQDHKPQFFLLSIIIRWLNYDSNKPSPWGRWYILTAVYGLYGDVPLDRVWFFSSLSETASIILFLIMYRVLPTWLIWFAWWNLFVLHVHKSNCSCQ